MILKNPKRNLKKLVLIVPMLVYSCLVMLVPANMLFRHDVRFMAALVLQKKTLMQLKKQIQILVRTCKSYLKKEQKTNIVKS